MTKLMQWLSALFLFLAVWLALVTESLPITVPTACQHVIMALPIYLLMTFACYSLAVIGYRVATFNDCTEASEELKRQIQEAREDLTRKGYKFS